MQLFRIVVGSILGIVLFIPVLILAVIAIAISAAAIVMVMAVVVILPEQGDIKFGETKAVWRWEKPKK